MFTKKLILIMFLGISLLFMSFINSEPSKDNKVDIAISSNTLESTDNGIVVLELFTSQGCSSCPPADVLLEKFKNEYPENVFVLSYHVDYWDYIGWADPFSNENFTVKQSKYNWKLGYRGNYTPELVVNGKEHLVGSNRVKVEGAIKKYAAKGSSNRLMSQQLDREAGKVNFIYKIKGATEGKIIRAVLLLNERITEVKRGENRYRTLKNSNIVVAEKYLEPNGNSIVGSITIPKIVKKDEKLILMLLIENDNADITGAVKESI
ncbi:DUF1223 domain-containing protein [Maribacter sp. Asnod1-A12]|uniref:DUF1223 domain-containing protein n=1 Tax=Maribacter sp. Asnod1-A12 TaxID=3160576 RepID=UPI00386C3F67